MLKIHGVFEQAGFAALSLSVPAAECLHELFEGQADTRGEAVAVVCGGRELSYSALESRANQVANHLHQLGIGPGRFVGIAFDRSELPIIAILGCLKAGAAYVPLDPNLPDGRISYIMQQAEISALLTERALQQRFSALFPGRSIVLDGKTAVASAASTRLARAETRVAPHDLCYVIFTSGSTGRPKGIMTEHRNAVHFIRAFNKVCRTTPADRVYQGFLLGFDGSVEEIWMALSNGAALVVGEKDAPRFGNDLAAYLRCQRVTYFSTVPTMLATMTEQVPSLRQLVVSGEVCQPQLVERWATPERLMLNVYGPTEATVNASAAVCRPGQPITIGRPLEGYDLLVLDGEMRPLAPGETGELYIGGAGIARGYFKEPDLTRSAFVVSPDDGRRLYRTGDLARIDPGGEIEYCGRIDSQVKIRGYRVELAEVEAVLLEQQHVTGAVVDVREHDGARTLAAYVLLDQPSATLDRAAVLAALRSRLPAYMVPSFLDVVTAFPRLASGKLDRKRLPAPASALMESGASTTPPSTPLEKTIAAVWSAVFGNPEIGVGQNFFLDLGGHSLLAAHMTARLRSEAGIDIAVRDVYSFPTVRELAEHVAASTRTRDAASSANKAPVVADAARTKPSSAIGMAQALMTVVFFGLSMLPLIVLVPLADGVLRARTSPVAAAVMGISFVLALWPLMLGLSIAAKWLIIGRYRAGAYPLWGSYYLRWWVVTRLQAMSGAGLLAGTPLMSAYYRLMGAKVGRHCALDTAMCSIFDLVSIGEDTSIGAETQLPGCRIEGGQLLIGAVEIGNRCFIGTHSALGLDVRMADESKLDDQSLLPDGAALSAGEWRRGSPAQPAEVAVPQGPPLRSATAQRVLFTIGAFCSAYMLVLLSALPALGVTLLWLFAFEHGELLLALLLSTLALPLLIALQCTWIAALKAMLLLGQPISGTRDLYSLDYLRHWLAHGLMRASRLVFLPVFTTLYLPPWLRLLGARIGARSEMSTVRCFTPELLSADSGSFFADGCLIGGRRAYAGRFELAANRVGSRSFVGNSAILPPGAGLANNCLLGVLSAPPARTDDMPDGSDWLGSPPFALPNRQKVGGFDEQRTFSPTPGLYAQRAVIDGCRILVPAIGVLGIASLAMAALLLSLEALGPWIMLALAPFVGIAMAALAVAIVVGLKWAVMGKFQPVIVPLWCPYVWLNEMVNGAYESLMAPVVSMFFGTPFAAPLLRLIGCRIGRYCYIDTTLFSEFDLVQIGDCVALNAGAVIQNHLFEDRIMKSSYVRIGDGCSVGNMAVVLYDGQMHAGAVLGPLSLLMKGEVVPSATRWHGIPTVKA
jgi:non-ribosomal peptide synthetase-like protein